QPAARTAISPEGGDDKARALIAAATPLMAGGAPASFVTTLFGRTAPEDLVAYEPRDLANLAQDAWEFLAERQPGTVKMRLAAAASETDRLGAISVIEIINDDKPFLLDSTMSQLAELGVEVKLVAHPVVTTNRDAAGRLTGFGNGGKRESYIHIH